MKTLRTLGLLTSLAIFAISTAGPARALPIMGDFNITFAETFPGTDTWSGMFSTNALGIVTSFMAEVGLCAPPTACLYDFPLPGFVWDGMDLDGDVVATASVAGVLIFDVGGLGPWTAVNSDDLVVTRFGDYTVLEKVAMPEPSSFMLLLVGLGALAGFSLRRRSRQA